ncbi:hypothetical protein [Bacillus sp. J33]|uniref:hypothetical protein n=1 Tax=Bacillus sp. J33 TaxID=935836 RepID=UPI00047A8593|nr:hypothetical protein [Bacillus sp. J33]
MIKRVIAVMVIMLFVSIQLVNAVNEIPAGAQEFANHHFYEIVKDELGSADSAMFNLDPNSENITFGPLFKMYTMSKKFFKEKNPDLSIGIYPSGEYIAVVYQDGEPINVIGTYENESGEFTLSTLGYGKDLALELDNSKGKEWVLHEAPSDGWYLYNGETVVPLTERTKELLKGETPVKDFQRVIYDRYKNVENKTDRVSFAGNMQETVLFYSLLIILGLIFINIIIKKGSSRIK